MNVLLDETRLPPLRQVIGQLMSAATHADFAVSNVRLAAIDIGEAETSSIASCRFLLARLDARELTLLSAPRAQRRDQLHGLQRFLESGRIEIRNAGTGAWHPDFSVYTGLRGAPSGLTDACLVGAHYFYQPLVAGGPSFTCMLTEAAAVAAARARFQSIWQGGHDVGAVIRETINRALQHGT
jgi:hypothetical protein